MTPARDVILSAIEAALLPLVDTGGLEFDPGGDPDPSIDESLAVFDHGDNDIEREAVLVRREMDLTIEGYVRRGGGRDGSADRNALHARMWAAIMADETLGGAAELITFGDLRKTRLEFDSTGRLMFAQDLAIQFVTLRTNPALPA